MRVDARGLSCPQPVILTMDALRKSQGNPVLVLVDSEVARDNVTRLATRKGFKVETRPEGGHYVIEVSRPDPPCLGRRIDT